MKRLVLSLLAMAIGIDSAHAVASDFSLLGLYIGGSVGRSEVRTRVALPLPGLSPYDFDQSDTGWKALVGLRPIPLFAAELAYVDFGHPTLSTTLGLGAYRWHADVLQRAQTLSGLIFVPIPIPMLELYGRAGIARLQSSGNPNDLECAPGYECPLIAYRNVRFNRTNTDFQYGAGLQLKLSKLAVRVEYERINDSRGDPDLLSAGLVWTF